MKFLYKGVMKFYYIIERGHKNLGKKGVIESIVDVSNLHFARKGVMKIYIRGGHKKFNWEDPKNSKQDAILKCALTFLPKNYANLLIFTWNKIFKNFKLFGRFSKILPNKRTSKANLKFKLTSGWFLI